MIGSLIGCLLPRGRALRVLRTAWFALGAVAVIFLVIGTVALIEGQPWGIWYCFLLPGAVGALVMGANTPAIFKRYREAEERRLAAKDLI